MKTSTAVLAGALFVFAEIIPAKSQIQISGALSGFLVDTVYQVTGEISVAEGDLLTILPGAVLKFTGNYDFDIYGYLNAAGEENNGIAFELDTGAVEWGGVDFYSGSSDSCLLEYCDISGSGASALDCFGSSPRVKNCWLRGNSGGSGGGVYCNSTSSPLVENCYIEDNTAFMGGGVYSNSETAEFVNCYIVDNFASNYGGGITTTGNGTSFTGCYINYNTVSNSYTTGYGGGLYCTGSTPFFEDCSFFHNQAGGEMPGVGGGIFTTYSDITIYNCKFRENLSGEEINGDGGALYFLESNALVTYTLISGNTAQSMGGGVFLEYSDVTLTNCSLSRNSGSLSGGGIYIGADSQIDLRNTIVESSYGVGGVYFYQVPAVYNISYNDFFGNQGGDFHGQIPPGLGTLVMTNFNGDSCDQYYNIYMDPLFVEPGMGNFNLTENSPCIDAGDPASPIDPDGTIADMGAYYFNQGIAALVSLDLTYLPLQNPVTFIIVVGNAGLPPLELDIWTMAALPSGSIIGPLMMAQDIILPGAATIERVRQQLVPAHAPAGTYTYYGYAGVYPNVIIAADSFEFDMLNPESDNDNLSDWSCGGELFGDETTMDSPSFDLSPLTFDLLPPSPNPFNSSTTITFTLTEAAEIKLAVFDVLGREIAVLRAGDWGLGKHTVVWEAEGVGSGVYFVRLMVEGKWSMVEKVALMK